MCAPSNPVFFCNLFNSVRCKKMEQEINQKIKINSITVENELNDDDEASPKWYHRFIFEVKYQLILFIFKKRTNFFFS